MNSCFFPTITEFKFVYATIWENNYSPLIKLFTYRRNFASLSFLYPYFHGKPSNKLKRPLLLGRATGSNHSHFLSFLTVRRKFHTDSPPIRTSWNRLPWGCLVYNYKLNHFKSTFPKCIFELDPSIPLSALTAVVLDATSTSKRYAW